MEKQYYINAEYVIPRAENDDIRNSMMEEFKPIKPSDTRYYQFDFVLDKTNAEIIVFDSKEYPITLQAKWERFIRIWQMLPSSLALYRLMCTFGSKLKHTYIDGYKGIWGFELVHKETGIKLCVGDNKGGFSFLISYSTPDQLETAHKVGKRFLSLLIDKNFTHTYNRTVAGSVA